MSHVPATIKLNRSQQGAFDKIQEFLLQSKYSEFYLIGHAGTGKTLLTSSLVKNLLVEKKVDQVFILAPTHKALNVIESYIRADLSKSKIDQNRYTDQLSFVTIHKFLEVKPVIMADTGEKVFRSARESKFVKQLNRKLIIIDECSMISSPMVSEMAKYTEVYPVHIMYIGDPQQLPPVSEECSSVFTRIPKNYRYAVTLTKIMRTRDNDIRSVCHTIREWDMKSKLLGSLVEIFENSEIGTFKLFNHKENIENSSWFKSFLKCVDNGGKIPIILTWRNQISDKYNLLIRGVLHNTKDLIQYLQNDLIMFNNFYHSPFTESTFYTSNMLRITSVVSETRQLCDWNRISTPKSISGVEKEYNRIVRKLAKIPVAFKIDLIEGTRVYNNLDNISDRSKHKIQTVSRASVDEYEAMKKIVREEISAFYHKTHADKVASHLWDFFYKNISDPFAEINFGHSLTVYKSQGSTFDIVYVDFTDLETINNIQDFKKALYTAAGRASTQLCLIV